MCRRLEFASRFFYLRIRGTFAVAVKPFLEETRRSLGKRPSFIFHLAHCRGGQGGKFSYLNWPFASLSGDRDFILVHFHGAKQLLFWAMAFP